jgi:hypothetical protein
MHDTFQRSLALLWRRILRSDPSHLFGPEVARSLDRNWGDRIPQPGFVGPRYRIGGLVFVSMNPGGGRGGGLGPEDIAHYEALGKLRDRSEEDAVMQFRDLNALLLRHMPTWRIFQVFVQPVLSYGALDFSEVGYLNLLKWRTQSSSGLNKLYDLSWHDHTRKQFDLLQPSIVIAIGSDAGNAFRRHHTAGVHFDAIPRVIGNNIGAPGRAALERIGAWLRQNPVRVAKHAHR